MSWLYRFMAFSGVIAWLTAISAGVWGLLQIATHKQGDQT